MPVFRTDLYLTVKVQDFDLKRSSQQLFQLLNNITTIKNLQMTRVTREREIRGKIRIEEWYEMTGALVIPEGAKAFWVLSKEWSEREPYHFFMRIDRNVEASDRESAQRQASAWIDETLIRPLRKAFSVVHLKIGRPEQLSKKAQELRQQR